MQIIEDVAILIPIHPPKYHFLYSLLKNIEQYKIKIDIYLVFSNRDDYENFNMKSHIHPIIVSEPMNNEGSIVIYKKFYGLKQLADSKYDYIISCDSEIELVPENFTNENIMSKIHRVFENKKIYGGDAIGHLAPVISSISANIFPDHQEKLRSMTNNLTVYFWWSDIPVYRRKDITDFLSYVNYSALVWEHFDHIMYQYYLIIKHDFVVVNYTPIIKRKWSLEELYTSDETLLNKLSDMGYGFAWVTGKLFNLCPQIFVSKGTFLKYHMDCTHHGMRWDTLA